MGNENEIKDLTKVEGKSIFLQDVINELTKQAPPTYDVDTEFAKARKNRSIFVPIIIILFVLVFIGVAVGVTIYSQNQSKNVSVSISDFQDVNLRDILDKAKKNEDAMRNLKRELEDLKTEQETMIQQAREEAQRNIEILDNENLSQDVKAARIRSIRTKEAANIEKIRKEYGDKIKQKEEQIAALQAEIDAYDARQLAQAKQREEVLNNQRRLFDMEMKKATDYYENKIKELTDSYTKELKDAKQHQEELVKLLKGNYEKALQDQFNLYNPTFGEDRVKGILNRPIEKGVIGPKTFGGYRTTLQKEGIATPEEYAALQRQLDDFSALLKRMKNIPYKNSMPQALNQVEYLGYLMVRDYDGLLDELVGAVDAKNRTIGQQNDTITQFLYALDFLTQKSRENGYVLDPRNSDRIVVYLDKLRPVKDGALAYVFRRDDEPIASVRMRVKGDSIYANLVSLESKDKPIEPFDKVLVQLQ